MRNESSRPAVTVLPVTSLLDCTSQTRTLSEGSLTLMASARLLFRLYQAPARVPGTTLNAFALETISVSSGELVATFDPAWNQPRVVPSATPSAERSRPYSPMKTVSPDFRIALGFPIGMPVGTTVGTVGVTLPVGVTVTLPVGVTVTFPVGVTTVGTVSVGVTLPPTTKVP